MTSQPASQSSPKSQRCLTRRQLLKQGLSSGLGLVAAPALLNARVFAANTTALAAGSSLNEKLNLAVIGCGGRGGRNMREMAGENVVALCDVDENNLRRAAEMAPRAKQFRDFRKLYDELRDSKFDAVVVSTTEHTHACATLPALHRKKHVYCEKPLTHNIHECRLISEAAREAGVATQMGTQIHASSNYRRVVELVQCGAIGPVREAHVWVSRAWGRQSEQDARANNDIVFVLERPTESQPVPDRLDWDLWLGPAPQRPFHEVYVPGPKWYRWWDFGSGTMSDLGSHWNDLPFWALNLDAPKSVEAAGPPPHEEIAPASMSATYTYGPRGDMPPVRLTWYQGTMKPKPWQDKLIPQWNNGVLFIGDDALLLAEYRQHVLLTKDGKEFTPSKRPEQTIPESIGHHAEWIRAAKTGGPTTCHFGYSGPLTEANHLGNVAYRAGKKIEWDPQQMRIPNAPDAERFLGREYRKSWTL